MATLKGGPKKIGYVGRWHRDSGLLEIPFGSVWERRADLTGTRIINAVLPLSVITKVGATNCLMDCDISYVSLHNIIFKPFSAAYSPVHVAHRT
jgi:hypothetical protein